MESVAATLPKTPDVAPRANLSALLLDAGVGDTDSDSNDFKTRRKRALGSSSSANQEITRTYARGASTSRSTPTSDAFEAQGMLLGRVHLMADTVGLAEAEEERDENLYCFCQRGSFGEMIGCDSDDCKYEWVYPFVLAVIRVAPDHLAKGSALAEAVQILIAFLLGFSQSNSVCH